MKCQRTLIIVALGIMGCGANVDKQMRAAAHFTISEQSRSVSLEARLPAGLYIISLFLFVPPEYPPVKGDDIHVDFTLVEDGVQQKNYPVTIELSEDAIAKESVQTIAPGNREGLSHFRTQCEGVYAWWPYYSAIDDREGRLYRAYLGVPNVRNSGKQVKVDVRFLDQDILPQELRSWQLRIDPYTGK